MRPGASRRGALIALSGVDCAGKSTQRELLLEALRSAGHEPVVLWTRPGYTPGLETTKKLLRALTGRRKAARQGVSREPSRYPRRAADFSGPLARRLWLTAALLDLLWIYGVRFRLARARGRAVVCDRYLLDCLVDFRVNFPDERVEQRWLGRMLRRHCPRPEAAFCLVIEPARSMERARAKGRFHWETMEVLEQRRREYGALARELSVETLDGERPVEEIARSIRRRLADVLGEAPFEPGLSEPTRTTSRR